MDALRRDDLETARRTPVAEKARQIFDLIRLGCRIQRAALRSRHPAESEAELEAHFQRWLARDH